MTLNSTESVRRSSSTAHLERGVPRSARPLFSVVIPLHNKGPHVSRSVGSVLRQSVADFELIVVNDDSTDDSMEQLAKFDDPRIRTLHRSPAGPGCSGARNVGIRAAVGEIVAFLDADDEWRPEFLARVKGMAEAHPEADIFATGYLSDYGDRVEPDPFSRTVSDREPRCLDFKALLRTWLTLGEPPMCASAVAIRRSTLELTGGFTEGLRRSEDKEAWLRHGRGRILCISPEPLAVYYKESVNMMTRAANNESTHSVCSVLQPWIAAETDPDLRRDMKRLNNLELWGYARSNARALVRGPDLSRDFYRDADPWRYAEMRLLRMAPSAVLRAMKATKALFAGKSSAF